MNTCLFCGLTHHVGFISTRFAGTDGVSLETAKWAEVFQKEGFSCFYFGGELDRPPDCSYLVEEAHFTHPDIKDIYNTALALTNEIGELHKKFIRLKKN